MTGVTILFSPLFFCLKRYYHLLAIIKWIILGGLCCCFLFYLKAKSFRLSPGLIPSQSKWLVHFLCDSMSFSNWSLYCRTRKNLYADQKMLKLEYLWNKKRGPNLFFPKLWVGMILQRFCVIILLTKKIRKKSTFTKRQIFFSFNNLD